MTQDMALDMIIKDFVSREIDLIKGAAKFENANIDTMKKMYFEASEFATIQLPEEKRKTIIQRAFKWIQERWPKTNNKESIEQGLEKESTIEKDDWQR